MSRRTARADVVERELAALNASLVSARRFRNAGVSASCGLPAELLTSILLHLQANWQPERHKISEGAWKLTLGWMTVLQVCNLWREVSTVIQHTQAEVISSSSDCHQHTLLMD